MPATLLQLRLVKAALPQEGQGVFHGGQSGAAAQAGALDGGNGGAEPRRLPCVHPGQPPRGVGAVEDVPRPGGVHHRHREGLLPEKAAWYDAVKGVNSLARVYIPFDFRWNAGQVEGFKFGVMDMLPRLNNLLRDTDYGIAWHAYPEEFDDPVFADDRYALEQANTPIINLKNLHILTDYMSQGDMLSPAGVPRHLILSEQGFTSLSPARGGQCEELQAQCIVQAYEAAAANPLVEAFMLNRLRDEQILIDQNYAFGLLDVEGNRKLSWDAYENLGK